MGEEEDEAAGIPLRAIPQVDRLSGCLPASFPHAFRVDAAREAIASAAELIRSGGPPPSLEELARAAGAALDARSRGRLRPVVNATGVLLHTNLGRAPLSQEALQAAQDVAAGYSNLELDLATGKRGSRYGHNAQLLTLLTGAEAALVVNNNAASVLLCLAGLARGKEVIISRGELLEIGGGFRIPEIMAESGATMREVGTTNRTHLRDYEQAIGSQTAAVLKVHPSNFEVTGFTASVSGRQLAALCRSRGICFVHDVGSGLLHHRIAGGAGWLSGEPSVEQALAAGADLVTFSGDKLLGGPQAGIIVGRADAVGALRRCPLLRAFRADKTTLAALQSTLWAYALDEPERIPFWRMALADVDGLRSRAELLKAALPQDGNEVQIVEGFSTTGGGSAPSSRIPSILLKLHAPRLSPKALAERLLAGDPPILARIQDHRLIMDMRTIDPDQDAVVTGSLAGLLKD